MTEIKIAIVYHSGYGHTEKQAEHVQKGAASVPLTMVDLLKATDCTENPEILNNYDGIIFGAPTYMGSASGPFKMFMDATSKVWMKGGWKDKIAGGFTNSGSMSGDKLNTLHQFVTLAAQHGMIWVSLGEANESGTKDTPAGHPSAINRIGSYIGAMAQSDNLPADQTPPEGDLKTAERLGARIAKAAHRWSQ